MQLIGQSFQTTDSDWSSVSDVAEQTAESLREYLLRNKIQSSNSSIVTYSIQISKPSDFLLWKLFWWQMEKRRKHSPGCLPQLREDHNGMIHLRWKHAKKFWEPSIIPKHSSCNQLYPIHLSLKWKLLENEQNYYFQKLWIEILVPACLWRVEKQPNFVLKRSSFKIKVDRVCNATNCSVGCVKAVWGMGCVRLNYSEDK